MQPTCDLCGTPNPRHQVLPEAKGPYVKACEACLKLADYLKGWK